MFPWSLFKPMYAHTAFFFLLMWQFTTQVEGGWSYNGSMRSQDTYEDDNVWWSNSSHPKRCNNANEIQWEVHQSQSVHVTTVPRRSATGQNNENMRRKMSGLTYHKDFRRGDISSQALSKDETHLLKMSDLHARFYCLCELVSLLCQTQGPVFKLKKKKNGGQ